MTGLTRKLTLIAAGLVALIVAATAGAIVKDTIFTITLNHYAKLSGTRVYCQNNRPDHGFVCAVWGANNPAPNLYSVLVAPGGVAVHRVSKTGTTDTFIAAFRNP